MSRWLTGRGSRPATASGGALRRVLLAMFLPMLAACSDPAPAPKLDHLVALDPPRDVAAFELTDQHDRPFTAADLRGRWTVLFVGFTHCPDICPTTLGLLASVDNRLPEARRPLQFVFVSADPERDTPARLRDYVGLFNADWAALTGPFDQLDRLLDSLQLAYVKVPMGNGDYTIDHSTALVLIDPKARMAGFYPAPHEPAELVADLGSL